MTPADLAMLAVLLQCPVGADYGSGHAIGTTEELHFVWLADSSMWSYCPAKDGWQLFGPPRAWRHFDTWVILHRERQSAQHAQEMEETTNE